MPTDQQNENQDQLTDKGGENKCDNIENAKQDPDHDYNYQVTNTKQQRKDADVVLQSVKSMPCSRERSLAITKFQEGIMWLGMELKRLGEANPYPQSYNPESTKIEPTADNLKL